MVLGAMSLLTLFVFPMWRITLFAPQYPTGVTMLIHINKIGGETPSTIQNINILNHYVGMKFIEPDAIPELKYFPKIIIGMALLSLIAAAVNKPWMYYGWGVLMVVLAVAGLYDFYLWEYDYGHGLSETAPIKIEGASFQPPLLGKKDILNFVAVSMPHTAGYFAGLSILLAFVAGWLRTKFTKHEKTRPASAAPVSAAVV